MIIEDERVEGGVEGGRGEREDEGERQEEVDRE